MSTGYSRSPRLLKGAFVELGEPFLGPVPNIIVFQYNPENLRREMAPSRPSTTGEATTPATAAPHPPAERIKATLLLDAADDLEEPDEHPVTALSGLRDRISALELLLYPTGEETLVGQALGSLFGAEVPRKEVPIVLFVWGPGLILPVRLDSMSVEEEAFSPTLFPIRAKVDVDLRVLTPEEIEKPVGKPNGELSASKKLAVKAWQFTHGQRELLARANLANSGESILGMLPF